jgi:hypothetical protein
MALLIFSRYGKQVQKSCELKDLIEAVEDKIIPGTMFEAVWDKDLLSLNIFDVTFYGVERTTITSKKMTPQSFRKDVSQQAQPGKATVFVTSDSSSVEDSSLFEETDSFPIEFVEKLQYYYPAMPSVGDPCVLKLPPDDWRMELKVQGERVIVMTQPDDKHLSMDLRQAGYDARSRIRERLVARLDQKQIHVIPTVDYCFPQAFSEWRGYTHAEGVILKRRNGVYEFGKEKALMTDHWIKLEYEREENESE